MAKCLACQVSTYILPHSAKLAVSLVVYDFMLNLLNLESDYSF